MKDMELLMRRVVEEFGNLISVAGGSDWPIDPVAPQSFWQYEFQFEHGCLTVSANPDDDTVRLKDGRMDLAHAVLLHDRTPWSTAVGCRVRWIWTLSNQQGYRDGLQIEFTRERSTVSVQLMCMASAIVAACVTELEGQFASEYS